MSKDQYAMFTYDIPYKSGSAYGRIRRATGKYSIPITWSCYLVPFAMKSVLETVMKEEEEKTKGIRWSFIKYDDVENDKIDELAKKSWLNLMGEAKTRLMDKITAVQEEVEGLDAGRRAVKAAKKKIDDARATAAMFLLGDSVIHFLASFEKLIEAKVKLLDDLQYGKEEEEKAKTA